MNDDYLWDRTGEPDLEVQELEEVLGTLRYQPQPFVLPDDVQPVTSRKWYPVLAIAATIALIALALGVWLRVQQKQAPQTKEIVTGSNQTSEQQAVVKELPSPKVDTTDKKEVVTNSPRAPRNSPMAIARNQPGRSSAAKDYSAANRAEAEAAKEQLMLALRVVSAKLNFAQRKTVPGNNNVRYQHKVG